MEDEEEAEEELRKRKRWRKRRRERKRRRMMGVMLKYLSGSKWIRKIKRLCRLVLLRLKRRVSLKWYPLGWDPLQFWRVPAIEIGQQPSSEFWFRG